ncbi:hypothetical protein AVEN_67062-1 [Araneus ventricosus]|uniref:Uncharacterized protein n=1 Tax=Araneus ventricosus TaxID=182803 RepID=A0A4Y2U5S1_ARAVE|nr:hypothetical protein AVEN_67062-1 [Araneus ventricosus]
MEPYTLLGRPGPFPLFVGFSARQAHTHGESSEQAGFEPGTFDPEAVALPQGHHGRFAKEKVKTHQHASVHASYKISIIIFIEGVLEAQQLHFCRKASYQSIFK